MEARTTETVSRKGYYSAVWGKWIVRLCYAAVFIINVMCAVQFIFWPDAFMSAYELQGVPGRVALQGLGVAFLMWNATYPAVIINPVRFKSLAVVVLVQQAIGLAGESLILFSLPAGHEVLVSSIVRFICFDAAGLVLMSASLLFCCFAIRKLPV